MSETIRIGIERTRKGYPALWESGGGMMNTGGAMVVAGPRGEKLKPVYIRGRGHLANSKHALFVIREGYTVVWADHHRGDYHITLLRITKILDEEAELEPIADFDQGEWGQEPPEWAWPAIEAVREKASCYHCREPHYAKEVE